MPKDAVPVEDGFNSGVPGFATVRFVDMTVPPDVNGMRINRLLYGGHTGSSNVSVFVFRKNGVALSRFWDAPTLGLDTVLRVRPVDWIFMPGDHFTIDVRDGIIALAFISVLVQGWYF